MCIFSQLVVQILLPYTHFSATVYKSAMCTKDTMTDYTETFLQFTAHALMELESSIPELHERMIVRTLRMLMENGMVEASTDAANGWERVVEIYVELRDTISALASAGDHRSAASRLCSGISDGLKVQHLAAADMAYRSLYTQGG
jgi:hypothetical protein